jgi:hypothetical protein
MGLSRRMFTKEFKLAAVQRLEHGRAARDRRLPTGGTERIGTYDVRPNQHLVARSMEVPFLRTKRTPCETVWCGGQAQSALARNNRLPADRCTSWRHP